MEHWKPIRDYEGLYEVSDLGNVMRIKKYLNSKDTPLRPANVANYHRVTLSKDGVTKGHLVHRLVADAFIGIPDGMVVNHKNGNKTDNRLANIEVVSRKENEFHKWNVLKTGAKPGAKLTRKDADDIRKLRAQGLTLHAIAKMYGVYFTNIHHIVTNKTWLR